MLIAVYFVKAEDLSNMNYQENVTLETSLSTNRQDVYKYRTSERLDIHKSKYSTVKQNKRHLASAIDVSQTTVNGLSDFEINQTKTITAIPRDSSGNALGSGCDIYIQISNQ